MGLVSALFDRNGMQASTPFKPWDDFWYENVAGIGTAVGIPVTPLVALQVGAVFACVKVISEDIATLPLITYRRREDGGSERARDLPLYSLLHDSPNEWQTAFEFFEDQTGHAALHGKCFAEILPGAEGAVSELVPLHPDRVTVEQLPSRRLRYKVRQPNGAEPRILTQDQMFHVRGRSLDFMNGISVNVQARDAIALARAIDIYGSRFFANDASIGSALEHPGKLSRDAHERLKESFASGFGGLWNAHKPKILEEGMKFTRIPITNARDAQLTQAQEAAVIPICQFFRMQPHKVAHLLHATFSNIEHQGIEYVQDTLQPWCRRFEQRINATLVTEKDVFAEFLLTGKLRGDSAARAAYYQSRFNNGSLSVNEIRRYENENPLPADIGDRYFVQGAMVPIDRIDEQIDRAQKPAPSQTPRQQEREAASAVAVLAAPDFSAFSALATDVGERIAKAETRKLSDHPGYIRRAISPLLTTWTIVTGATFDEDAIVAGLTATGKPDGDTATWSATRAGTIAAILKQEFDRVTSN